jgi:GT2 family glycosyltransferase/SAM-dependent methyltransferase
MTGQDAADEPSRTGERYGPEIHGNITLEHLHRYAFACEIAAGQSVLDVACGEGYGSAMLAEVAHHVVGVDSSREAILHASQKYTKANLQFMIGSCVEIPTASHSVDLVVSFETIEHHDQHERMLLEIKRVLRPAGVLVISTPNKYEYSVVPDHSNPYHIKELYRHELESLLGRHFKHCAIYGQRVVYGSGILPESALAAVRVYSWNGNRHNAATGMPRPRHLVVLAGDVTLPAAPSGLFEQPITDSDIVRGWANTVAERDRQLTSLQLACTQAESLANERARQSDELVQVVYASKSWRFTAPLRAVGKVMRRFRRRVREIVSPIGERLRYLSSGLARRRDRSRPVQPAQARPAMNAGESMVANGTVEWVDYPVVRHRIDTIEREQLASVDTPRRQLIHLGHEDLLSAARRLALPDAGNQPDVSIIIPAYNNLKYTLECLLSVCTHTGNDIRYEVIVADDASTDDTRRVLTAVPHLRLMSNDSNLGFVRNCNRAAGLANGRYLLFLNNDTQVTRAWLEPMLRVFQDERDVGAVGPMMVFPDGRLQEAGARLRRDGTAEMIGLFDSPANARFRYRRDVEYCSGACLLLETGVFRELGGFDERYAPAYCEDSDLCLRLRKSGRRVVYCPDSVIVHHLSITTSLLGSAFKSQCVGRNIQQLRDTWQEELDRNDDVRIIAFYLPQFHRIPENDLWWGTGFTEWSNITRARPNFIGHHQPRLPADLGYYDLRVPQVMEEQADLAKRYGIHGFCFYYYWFHGKRLLEAPLERMLATGQPDIPFCLCWANENWTRRWDGRDNEILMAQDYSDEDDEAVIHDLLRYFRSSRYIRVHGKPLILVYRVTLFPDFARTARRWRQICRDQGIGEIYITMVESFELVRHSGNPARYGCDAGVEFPPHGMADARPPSGQVVNPKFRGTVADYRDLAVRFATRPYPRYTRFLTVMPGWDNTPRRQDDSFCFEHATPGAFQAWAEAAIERTKQQCSADERFLFINAWNEWAEGAYLEPDRTFGHTFLEAILNARDASALVRSTNVAQE